MQQPYFSRKSFSFLADLEKNNNRDWFNEHKPEYESTIREPALDFIADISSDLAKISPHFNAVPKKVGGSLMRIYRDVRFGKDKSPYKTNIGIQFRHEIGKDVHAPGFYVHIANDECFVGAGVWRPDSSTLKKIREKIVSQPEQWKKITTKKTFKQNFELVGDSLVNPPRGFPKEHVALIDLKRKDHIAISPIKKSTVTSKEFKKDILQSFRRSDEYMRYLCSALNLNY